MKTFQFHNAEISIEVISYGQYVLRGLGTSVRTSDSSIWDYVDDEEENPEKSMEARRTAYRILKNNQ